MQAKLRENARTVDAYTGIAPVYDYVMRHVNYNRWFDYIDSLLKNYAPNLQSLLEIACGTGTMLEKFSRRKYCLLGMDKSFEMLENARKRLTESGCNYVLWCGDMRTLAIRIQVDAAICLYDSINYCLTQDEFVTTLNNVYACLKPSGVFIFDVCTLKTCKTYFKDYYEKDSHNGIDYIRKSGFDRKNDWQVNEFWFAPRYKNNTIFYERHIQKIYSLHAVKKILKQQIRWKVLGIFNNFTKRRGTERSYRVHFVLRKV